MERAYDHSEFRERVEAYLAGGLDAAERSRFEAHAEACDACAALLSDGAAQDASLRELFEGTHPGTDFEDRIVVRLRAAAAPGTFLHPMVRRAATGVAAALMLGGFGYVANQAINQGGLPSPWARQRTTASSHIADPLAEIRQRGAGESAPAAPRLQTPADMVDRFNAELSDHDADAARWFYKERAGEANRERQRGRWDEGGQSAPLSASRSSSTMATQGQGLLGAHPAMRGVVPPTEEKLNRELDGEASKETGAAVARDKRGDDFVRADPKNLHGVPSAGTGGAGMGGPALAYNYGNRAGGAAATNSQGASTSGAPGAGGEQPGSARYYAGPDAANGRTPDAAPGNRSDPANNQFGLEVRSKQLADLNGVAEGKDRKYLAGKPGAFQPDSYFDAPAPTATPAPADGTTSGALRDGQSVPEDVVAGRELQLGQQQLAGDAAPNASVVVPDPAAAENAAPAVTNPAPANPAAINPTAGRKIIRNGEMTFEVDGFDSAYVQITKIAQEEGGFVATTDSEKLANGKVKGTVTIRVPPDRLDTLVLKLRGLGDLKSSKLAANDITKQYTDLESQLRASRAMEERLLNIIKTGKGEIKDLVEAEKQLGVYREKIEQVEGEIRYYNNLVSLSTLNVTLIERDIRTAAMLSETEQVNMGVESQDVEKARADAIKAIEDAKGRIVESDLKKLEAGQFAARVVADVPPDAAGPLIDRMKQIGTVARLEVLRKQSAPEGTVAPAPARGGPGVRLERRDTRFLISLYNLANVAPRQTTNLNLAAEDVEAAYRTVLDQVKGAGGRVVTSQLNRPRPDQTTGTITFEAPAEGADVLLGAVRAAGEVMRLEVSQNPDAQNVTEAKRGFAVQIFSIASVAPRETTSLRVAARGVADAFGRLREAVRAAQGARVLSSQLTEQDPANITGTLDFEVRRADWAAVETALRDAGQVVSRNVARSADTENTVDTKIRLQVVLVDEAALQPRESVTVQLAVADVPGQYGKLLEALAASQSRILQSQLSEQEAQNQVTGTLVFDVRRENRSAVDRALSEAGDVVTRSVVRSTDTQNTLDDKVRLSLTLTDAARLAPRETTTLGMEAADVEKAKEQIESLALSLGGRVVDSTLSREQNGRVIAKVVADVPLGRSIEMVRRTRDQGRVQFRRDARDETVPQGTLARARVDVTLANEELIVESGRGLGATIREGLRTSVTGLLWSLQLIVVGLFLVAPWALIVYVSWRLLRRGRARKQATSTVPAV